MTSHCRHTPWHKASRAMHTICRVRLAYVDGVAKLPLPLNLSAHAPVLPPLLPQLPSATTVRCTFELRYTHECLRPLRPHVFNYATLDPKIVLIRDDFIPCHVSAAARCPRACPRWQLCASSWLCFSCLDMMPLTRFTRPRLAADPVSRRSVAC